MQVFIVGSPLETARSLDSLRLNKQIVETRQILSALKGAKAWNRHPCVLQYKGHEKWLQHYHDCLLFYKKGNYNLAEIESSYATNCYPVDWHTQEYYDQMKRRLYTKNPEHYAQWAHLGKSKENWYWSQELNEFIKYINGKKL